MSKSCIFPLLYLNHRTRWKIRCSANHFLLSWILYPRYVMRIGMGSSQKKFQRYRPINDPVLLIFVFGSIIMGCFARFLESVRRFGRWKCHFLALQKCKSARFQVPKNGTLSAQIFERTPKTSRNTPQNGGVDIWFMHFHFRASIKPNFENC